MKIELPLKHKNLSELSVEYDRQFCGKSVMASKIRDATEEDLKRSEELYNNGKCPHNIVFDEDYYPWYKRTCYTCGEDLGLL